MRGGAFMDKNSVENVNKHIDNHVTNSDLKHDKNHVNDESKTKNSSNKKDRV